MLFVDLPEANVRTHLVTTETAYGLGHRHKLSCVLFIPTLQSVLCPPSCVGDLLLVT